MTSGKFVLGCVIFYLWQGSLSGSVKNEIKGKRTKGTVNGFRIILLFLNIFLKTKK